MFLLDGEHCNVFTHKAVNWSRLKQLFKDNPVVPLYGDMQTTLDHVLAQAPNFRSANWEAFDAARADPKVASKYLIIRNLDRYRSEYRSFLASWQIGLNARKLHPADKTISYNAAMTGLFLLSAWTGDVLSQVGAVHLFFCFFAHCGIRRRGSTLRPTTRRRGKTLPTTSGWCGSTTTRRS
jgi:hypothetical protein